MCWIGENKYRVAKDAIPVFKIGLSRKNIAFSYFYYFKYEVGKTYYEDIIRYPYDVLDKVIILEGLHSYSMDAKITQDNDYISVVFNNTSIELYSNHFTRELCKIECTIPKGAVYYQNEYGELVSDSLKIEKIENIIVNKNKIELIELQ
jgi:hypothetical protein